MTLSLTNRRTAGIIAALALGVAAPAAGAKPIDSGPAASDPPTFWTQTPVTGVQAHPSHPGGGISDWEYVAIGSGVASFALISVGGTRAAARRRRRQRAALHTTIAA